jgi:hypothetical protein
LDGSRLARIPESGIIAMSPASVKMIRQYNRNATKRNLHTTPIVPDMSQ